jgi:hypothetical protein
MKHKIYKESTHFQKNHIYSKKIKNHLPKQLYEFFITICKKNHSKIHLYEKKIGQKKYIVIF